MRSEYGSIKYLNALAEMTGLKIAYKCRTIDEKEVLEKNKLLSGRIKLIGRNEEPAYATVVRSDLILSTLSTLVLEAMGIGKKCGYVNISGNSYLNYEARELGIEFTGGSNADFCAFVEKMRQRKADYREFVEQSPRYTEELLAAVGKGLNK